MKKVLNLSPILNKTVELPYYSTILLRERGSGWCDKLIGKALNILKQSLIISQNNLLYPGSDLIFNLPFPCLISGRKISDLRGSSTPSFFLPPFSLGAAAGFDRLLAELLVKFGGYECKKCKGVCRRLSLEQELTVNGNKSLTAAVGIALPPGEEISLGEFMEIAGAERGVIGTSLFSREELRERGSYDMYGDQLKKEGGAAAIIDSISLPCPPERLPGLRQNVQRFLKKGGLEIFYFPPGERIAVKRRSYEAGYYCERCQLFYEDKRGGDPTVMRYEDFSGVALPSLTVLGLIERCRKHFSGNTYNVIIDEILRRALVLKEAGLGGCRLSGALSRFSWGERVRLELCLVILSGISEVVIIFDRIFSRMEEEEGLLLLKFIKESASRCGFTNLIVDRESYPAGGCDYVVDLDASTIVVEGRRYVKNVKTQSTSRLKVHIPEGTGKRVSIKGICVGPFKGFDFTFPLNSLVCLSGKTGSGKTILLKEVLSQVGRKAIEKVCLSVSGAESIKKARFLSEDELSFSPVDTIASFTGLEESIAEVFSLLLESRVAGLGLKDFVLSKSRYRCRACRGTGRDIRLRGQNPLQGGRLYKISSTGACSYSACDVCRACGGELFEDGFPDIHLEGKSVVEVYKMPLRETEPFFLGDDRALSGVLLLSELGFREMPLSVPVISLSRSQRELLKIYSWLQGVDSGELLLGDRPFYGLSAAGYDFALGALVRVVSKGNTALCAEKLPTGLAIPVEQLPTGLAIPVELPY